MPEREQKSLRQHKELVLALETTTTLIQTVLKDLKQNSNVIGQLQVQMEYLEDRLKELTTIISGNNLENGLVTRLLLIEQKVHELQNQLNIQDTEKKNKKTQEEMIRRVKTEGRWKIYGAIITGILGIIGSIISFIINK